jgi:PKD repeat protein
MYKNLPPYMLPVFKKFRKIVLSVLAFFISTTLHAQEGFTANVTTGCQNLTVTFTNNTTKGNVYRWSFGDGGTSSAKSPTYTYTRSGQFYPQLYVLDSSGTGIVSVGSYYINSAILVRGGVIRSNVDSACVSESINLSFSVTYWGAPSLIAWNFGDGSPDFKAFYGTTHSYSKVGTYTVTAFDSACPNNIMTKKIVVSTTKKPVVYFSFNNNTCPNENVNFQTQYSVGKSYSWNFGDGSPLSNSSYGQHAYVKTGKFPVTLTITNECGNKGYHTDTVYVVSTSVIQQYINIFPSTTAACPGDIIHFNSYIYAAYSQVWRFGNGDSSTQKSPDYAYPKAGTYTVTLEVTNGCGNSKKTTQSITIGLNPYFTRNVNMNIDARTVCPGAVVNFKGSPAKNYLWTFGDLTSSTLASPTHIYSKGGIYPVTLKLTNGCGIDTTLKDTVVVDNTTKPTLSRNSWGVPRNTACPNDSIIFFAIGGASYLFDFGDGTKGTKTTSFVDARTGFTIDMLKHAYKNSGNYRVRLILYNLCGLSTVDSLNITIGNSQAADGGITSLNRNLNGDISVSNCQPVNFIGYGGSTYKYKFGNGDSLTSSQSDISYAYSVPGNYNVTLTVINSCGQSAAYSASVIINSGILAASTTRRADTLFANTAMSYQWNLNDVPIAGATASYYKMKANGIYSVTINNGKGCTAKSPVVNGVNDIEAINEINVYPNPASQEVILSYTVSKNSHVAVTLTDLYGRMIKAYSEQSLPEGRYTEKIDLNSLNLSNGLYLVQIKVNTTMYHKRLSVLK